MSSQPESWEKELEKFPRYIFWSEHETNEQSPQGIITTSSFLSYSSNRRNIWILCQLPLSPNTQRHRAPWSQKESRAGAGEELGEWASPLRRTVWGQFEGLPTVPAAQLLLALLILSWSQLTQWPSEERVLQEPLMWERLSPGGLQEPEQLYVSGPMESQHHYDGVLRTDLWSWVSGRWLSCSCLSLQCPARVWLLSYLSPSSGWSAQPPLLTHQNTQSLPPTVCQRRQQGQEFSLVLLILPPLPPGSPTPH